MRCSATAWSAFSWTSTTCPFFFSPIMGGAKLQYIFCFGVPMHQSSSRLLKIAIVGFFIYCGLTFWTHRIQEPSEAPCKSLLGMDSAWIQISGRTEGSEVVITCLQVICASANYDWNQLLSDWVFMLSHKTTVPFAMRRRSWQMTDGDMRHQRPKQYSAL